MSRRVKTLLVGGAMFLILAIVGVTVPVPYVILGPGPTLNTLGQYDGQNIIAIDGRSANSTTGHLNLTTVSITTGRITAFEALAGWLAGDKVVVPREAVYPPNQTQQQVQQQDATDFTDSQNSAEGAAFCELGYPKGYGVVGVSSILTPPGALKVDDKLVSVNGKTVASQQDLQTVLSTATPGAKATVAIERQGKPQTVTVTLQKPIQGRTGASIGISATTTCFATFDVVLGLNQAIGGPSAGMMFALGIMEKVGNQDLTNGKFIAGTGTIDTDGTVGPIGGIQLKMIAARRAGATLFLAPADNCTDVRNNIPKGLTVAKVSTLHQAVQALLDVKAGKTVTGC